MEKATRMGDAAVALLTVRVIDAELLELDYFDEHFDRHAKESIAYGLGAEARRERAAELAEQADAIFARAKAIVGEAESERLHHAAVAYCDGGAWPR